MPQPSPDTDDTIPPFLVGVPGNEVIECGDPIPGHNVSAFDLCVGAGLACELGVLNLVEANGGINPATGNPWAAGDTYRLAFVSSKYLAPAP